MKIWTPGTDGTDDSDVLLNVDVNDDSYRFMEIMGEHYLVLSFSIPEYIEIPPGAWCEFEAETYTLEDPSNVVVHHFRNYEYKATFYSPFKRAERVKCRDTASGKLKFPLTAKPVEHLQLIVSNLNRNDSGWTVGDCIDSPEKVVQYNHVSCAEALAAVAEAFDTEYEVVRKVVSLKKVEYNKDNPLSVAYGKGNGLLPGIERNNDDSFPVDTLYVQGSGKNIDMSKYGSDELLMPALRSISYDGDKFSDEEGFVSSEARSYTVSPDGRSVSCQSSASENRAFDNEDSIDLSDIYPERIGEVSSVAVVNESKNLYDIADSSIPDSLDYSDCLIEGETMTVVFQSGMLAGREFEAKYIHDSVAGKDARRFELVPAEMDGYVMPGGNYIPAVGDKYAVFGVMLPDSYLRDDETKSGASWDLFREAVRNLWEKGKRVFEIKAELDGIWAKKDWLNIGGKILLGGYLSFTNHAVSQEPTKMRITSVKQYVNNPYAPEIQFSNGVTSGSPWHSALGRIDKAEVLIEENRKDSISYTKRRFRDAQETISMLQDSMLGFGESINPAAIETMAMLVGDRRLQFRFVENVGTLTPVSHSVAWDKDFSVIRADAGVIQHLTLGIDSISPSHSADEYTYWSLPEYVSPPITDGTKKYYLYAKVSKTEGTGEFYLSEDGIAFDGIAGYYHLLVGILNSEYLGERSWVSLYGFTEILPGQISTEVLKDPNGKLIIDLSSGKITGPVTFSEGSSGLKNIEEWNNLEERLNNWASDEYVSPAEKTYLLSVQKEITAEYKEIVVDANSAKVTTGENFKGFITARQKALDALTKYTAEEPENIKIESDYQDILNYFPAKGILLAEISDIINSMTVESSAKLEGFTKIVGGLIFSNILKLMEVDGTETSGLSGITKDEDGNYLPFAWAGGTYEEAQDGNAAVIIWPDGRAKFGVAEIDPYGRFVVYDSSRNPVIKMSREKVTSESTLKEGDVNEDINNDSHSIAFPSNVTSLSSSYDLPNRIVVKNNGTKLSVSTKITSSSVVSASFSGTYSVETSLALMKEGGHTVKILGYVKSSSDDEIKGNKSQLIDETVEVSSGTYYLSLIYVFKKTGLGTVSLSSIIDNSVVNMSYVRLYTNTEFGINGLMVARDSNNFICLSIENNVAKFVTRTSLGYVDVPGVLASGKVSDTGVITGRWGCKSSLFAASWGSSGTTGWCRITHNLGHTSYHVLITIAGDGVNGNPGCTYCLEYLGETYFVVKTYKNNVLTAIPFYYVVVGDNRPSLNSSN